jgi:hypothetical protein
MADNENDPINTIQNFFRNKAVQVKNFVSHHVKTTAVVLVMIILAIFILVFLSSSAAFYDSPIGIFNIADDTVAAARSEMMAIDSFKPYITNKSVMCAPLFYNSSTNQVCVSEALKRSLNIQRILTQIPGLEYAYLIQTKFEKKEPSRCKQILNNSSAARAWAMDSAMFADETRSETAAECKLLSDRVFACHYPINLPKKKKIGVCVADDSKYYTDGETLSFDNSRDHYFFSRCEETALILVLGLCRGAEMPRGMSKRGGTTDAEIIDFFTA